MKPSQVLGHYVTVLEEQHAPIKGISFESLSYDKVMKKKKIVLPMPITYPTRAKELNLFSFLDKRGHIKKLLVMRDKGRFPTFSG